jgi:hypothetical protein
MSRTDYETAYKAMRAAATTVAGEPLRRLIAACQGNAWLKVGGCDFEPDGFCYEPDYPYGLELYDDIEMLEAFFAHGNWSIRTAVQYRDLIFVNQVNGGDEWWTLKIDGDNLVPFESISFRTMAGGDPGVFSSYIKRLTDASVEQCRRLEY